MPTIRGWISGYPNSASGPVLRRDFEETRTISFLDLMELRFIAHFRPHVSMQTIRTAAEQARKEWNVQHPFALSGERYYTDRKRIFAKSAEETGDEHAWDAASGQHEMWTIIEESLSKGVEFDPNSYLAKVWRPDISAFPDILIDPRLAFGKPVVAGARVPTKTLYDLWMAEGSKSRVANWFGIEEYQVSAAVEYELQPA